MRREPTLNSEYAGNSLEPIITKRKWQWVIPKVW
nr:MAG TPA: hypothetical protein [Caudoviricetes sp.]